MAIETLSDLQRRFFDRMDEGQGQYITAQQATDVLNEAYSLLWGMYTRADPNFFESEYTITPVSGQRDYPLPTNFRRLLQVFAAPTTPGGQFVPMRRFGRQEYIGATNQFIYDTFWSIVPTYDILGQNIRLDPIPQTIPGYTIVLWYLPHYTPLVNTTDTLDPSIYPGHEQWIINQAVIQLKIGKEEQPASDLLAQNNIIAGQIAEDLKERDRGSARPVLDNSSWDGWV